MLTNFNQYYKSHPDEFISIEKKIAQIREFRENHLLVQERMERFKEEKRRRGLLNVLDGINF